VSAILEVRDVVVRFGGVLAVDGVSFDVSEGSIAGIIGPNGAGKTTLLNVISRFVTPTQGSVYFAGRSLLRHRSHDLARLGVARTFQVPRPFAGLTVLDHVRIGAEHGRGGGPRSEQLAWEVLEQLGLETVARATPQALPAPVQKRVDLARALAGRPRLLLLDEPAAGLTGVERTTLVELLREVQVREGCTVLLVEHDVELVSRVCSQVFVLNFGRLIAEGAPQAIRRHPAVLEAYLGEAADVGA